MKHIRMCDEETLYLDTPNVQFVLFVNDFKKGMRFMVVFIYVNSRK